MIDKTTLNEKIIIYKNIHENEISREKSVNNRMSFSFTILAFLFGVLKYALTDITVEGYSISCYLYHLGIYSLFLFLIISSCYLISSFYKNKYRRLPTSAALNKYYHNCLNYYEANKESRITDSNNIMVDKNYPLIKLKLNLIDNYCNINILNNKTNFKREAKLLKVNRYISYSLISCILIIASLILE